MEKPKALDPKLKPTIQRTLVQKNPERHFLVQGYHSGDFLGTVAQSGFTGAGFVIERTFSPNAPALGTRIWIPFAHYITLTVDDGPANVDAKCQGVR